MSGGELFNGNKALYHFEDLGTNWRFAALLEPKTNEMSTTDVHRYGEGHQLFTTDFVNGLALSGSQSLSDTRAVEDALAEIDGIWNSIFGTTIFSHQFQGGMSFSRSPGTKT